MAVQSIVIVNASTVLHNADVDALIPSLQFKFDRDFYPAWNKYSIPQVKFSFASMAEINHLDPKSWPIFLNKHSKEADALGWHDDQSGKIFSRVFVGDCIRLGLDWGTTISHEADEMILDPNIQRVWKMPNGELAALEACDPVESDALGYDVNGHKMSDFVLPAYFSTNKNGPYDFKHYLGSPCPALTQGGYQSVTKDGEWTQIYADMPDNIPGARALMNGVRRARRGRELSPNVNILMGDLF
jgi:hypothetical protein